jgi:DNA recombination protein RmuC
MEYVVSACIIAASMLAAVFMLRRMFHRKEHGDERLALSLLQNQVNLSMQQASQQAEDLRKSLAQNLQILSTQVAQALGTANSTMEQRLDNAAKVIGDVRQQLGSLKESSQQIVEVGRDIARLDEILRPPKLRGALGELFLGDLLAQILPASHFRLQFTFKGGDTVDAVVILRSGMVPIDAKFPLDNFRRILDSSTEEERKNAKRTFLKDIKVHVDAIARKYIRTDENTFDFALMYVPAENVYYETVIKDDELGGEMTLFSYALQRRVIPVSPNSFYAYLQTIILGLKGMRVEEGAREIINNLSRIQKEFDNFSEAFRLVGQHLDNSVSKFHEAQKRFSKMESKVEQMDGLARGLQAEEKGAPLLSPTSSPTAEG